MTDPHDRLEDLAGRGDRREFDAIVEDAVSQSRPSLDPACATDRWSVDPDGPSAVGFGIPASPNPVRVSLPDGTTSALPVDAVDGIWLNSSAFVLIDGSGNLDVCNTVGRCRVVRQLASQATRSRNVR